MRPALPGFLAFKPGSEAPCARLTTRCTCPPSKPQGVVPGLAGRAVSVHRLVVLLLHPRAAGGGVGLPGHPALARLPLVADAAAAPAAGRRGAAPGALPLGGRVCGVLLRRALLRAMRGRWGAGTAGTGAGAVDGRAPAWRGSTPCSPHPPTHPVWGLPLPCLLLASCTEPVEVIEPTVIAACEMAYPAGKLTVYVCDDGQRQAVRCEGGGGWGETGEQETCRRGALGACGGWVGQRPASMPPCSSRSMAERLSASSVGAPVVYVARDKVRGVPHHAKVAAGLWAAVPGGLGSARPGRGCD